jgi:hypothetical protein
VEEGGFDGELAGVGPSKSQGDMWRKLRLDERRGESLGKREIFFLGGGSANR